MRFPQFVLRLPDWVETLLSDRERAYPTVEERMQLAIDLARRNVQHGTGGPFGAAVFDIETGVLLAPGVNLVVPLHCSTAHAEIVALTIAQQRVGHFDLGSSELPSHELVSSTEPCAMCLGAVPWSGVRRLVCGARDEDARRIGFDEGAKPDDWVASLEGRGIAVLRDVCRTAAVNVLEGYRSAGGVIYNARLEESEGQSHPGA
jgi:tRNA(Arg) A34 adenosine deaminase TadA